MPETVSRDRWHAEVMCPPYAQAAQSIEDFFDRFYRRDRYHERGPEYVAAVLATGREMLKEYGVAWISNFDSVIGDIVSWYEEGAPCPITLAHSRRRPLPGSSARPAERPANAP